MFARRCVRVRNRSQPFVRGPYGRAYGKFCRRLVASFRVAGVALRDIQQRSVTRRKSFCVAGAILLRRFANMRGRFHGRRSTLDVSCYVFFVNRIGQGCVKWRQGANSVAVVAFCAMC